MGISQNLIERRAARRVLAIPGTTTLSEMTATLVLRGYPEHGTYVVVGDPAGGFRASLAAKLLTPVKLMGRIAFETPLIKLPIPPVTEVIRQDTAEAGGTVEARLRTTPGATFVVINDAGFVALFVNANLSRGVLDTISLLGLHGEHAQLGPGVAPLISVQPPTCPYCNQQGWYRFDNGHYLCQNCAQIVEAP